MLTHSLFSIGRSQRGEKEELSESASVAGARSSYTASMANQSRKGSTFDMAGFGLDTSRSPIPEEETSAKDSCKDWWLGHIF